MKINRLTLALLAGAALSLGACSNDDQQDIVAKGDNSISFTTYTSRASSLTSDNIADFGVLAYYNDGATWAATSSLVPDFMYNQKVEKSGANWIYDPIKYWPADASKKISFLGYTPYVEVDETTGANAKAASADGVASIITELSNNSYAGNPYLKFSVGTKITDQLDLAYASAMDQDNSNTPVNMQFKHALSRVCFKVRGWKDATTVAGQTFDDQTTVTIHSVKITTARKAATLDLKEGTWSNPVDVAGGKTEAYTVAERYSNMNTANATITGGDTEAKLLNSEGDYIMMLPNLDDDEYAILVDYTITTTDDALAEGEVSYRQKVYRHIKPNFEAGKAYAIIINIGMSGNPTDDPDPDVPEDPDPDPSDPDEPDTPTPPSKAGYIQFTATVSDWGGDNEVEITLVKNS